MNLQEYTYLWDGSQPGWTLTILDHVIWNFRFQFGAGGPSKSDIINLHKLLPEFERESLPHVYSILKACTSYTSKECLGNIEARHLSASAASLGLKVIFDSHNRGFYKANSENGKELTITDMVLGAMIAAKMKEAGLPVQETHVD